MGRRSRPLPRRAPPRFHVVCTTGAAQGHQLPTPAWPRITRQPWSIKSIGPHTKQPAPNGRSRLIDTRRKSESARSRSGACSAGRLQQVVGRCVIDQAQSNCVFCNGNGVPSKVVGGNLSQKPSTPVPAQPSHSGRFRPQRSTEVWFRCGGGSGSSRRNSSSEAARQAGSWCKLVVLGAHPSLA